MEIIQQSEPVAKIQHTCNWCNGIIEKGEKYERAFLKSDSVYVWKNHIKCRQIANKLNMLDYSYEGLTANEFQDYIIEEYEDIQTENKKVSFYKKWDYVCNYHLNETR